MNFQEFFDLLQSNIKGVAAKLYNDPRLDFKAALGFYGDDYFGAPQTTTYEQIDMFNKDLKDAFDDVDEFPDPNSRNIT
ncbi:unnamed protein product, partial [Mesorhabditis spiculigera]